MFSVGENMEVNNKRKVQKLAKKYFDFYFHTKGQVRREYMFQSPEEMNPKRN